MYYICSINLKSWSFEHHNYFDCIYHLSNLDHLDCVYQSIHLDHLNVFFCIIKRQFFKEVPVRYHWYFEDKYIFDIFLLCILWLQNSSPSLGFQGPWDAHSPWHLEMHPTHGPHNFPLINSVQVKTSSSRLILHYLHWGKLTFLLVARKVISIPDPAITQRVCRDSVLLHNKHTTVLSIQQSVRCGVHKDMSMGAKTTTK